MPARTKATARRKATRPKTKAARRKTTPRRPDVPQLFRLNIEVGNLDQADRFYGTLLGL